MLIRRLDPGLPLPSRAHPGDAGLDLFAAAGVRLEPGQRAVVPTGIAIALPDGYAAFVHPRSGLAARHGVTLVNAPGTVDAGYRGEIRVTLINTDAQHAVSFQRGDRVAQLVIQRVARVVLHEVESLPGSARGDRGIRVHRRARGGHASPRSRDVPARPARAARPAPAQPRRHRVRERGPGAGEETGLRGIRTGTGVGASVPPPPR